MSIFLGWFAVASFTWVLMTLGDIALGQQDRRRASLARVTDSRLNRLKTHRSNDYRPTLAERAAFERFNKASRNLFRNP